MEQTPVQYLSLAILLVNVGQLITMWYKKRGK
jgi:hypothetical protein